jgi:hypothetical protein
MVVLGYYPGLHDDRCQVYFVIMGYLDGDVEAIVACHGL